MGAGRQDHDHGGAPSRPPRRGPTVVVEHDVGEPIDIDAWVEEYVALALELEGIRPRVAPPVAASVG